MKPGHIFLIATLITLSAAGCVKSGEIISSPEPPKEEDLFTEYLIKKGHHYSNATSSEFSGNKLDFEVIFDSSATYTTTAKENAGDINKLYGFSDCNTLHQLNSARVGWVWNSNALELYAYCYVNGERESRFLGIAPVNEAIRLTIRLTPTDYIFSFQETDTKVARHCSDSNTTGYRLYPYFGGNETAPHDIRILIREL
jgi:hypothetical protein